MKNMKNNARIVLISLRNHLLQLELVDWLLLKTFRSFEFDHISR